MRCALPNGTNVPECYIRSLDELKNNPPAELDDDDGILDIPPLVIEPSEFRASLGACLACGGSVTFLYWIDDREVDSGAQCHRCGDVELVTFDPVDPKFRPVAALRLRLVHSRED